MGSRGRCLNPPPETDMGGKLPLPHEKNQKIDVAKNENKSDFQSSVTLTKRFCYLSDDICGVKMLPGTQLGGGMQRKAKKEVSTPYFGAWEPLNTIKSVP